MMKRKLSALIAAVLLVAGVAKGQEKFGNTLNVGLGLGYYGYYYAAPALAVNYEFDVYENLTIAPFAAISSYRSYRGWGNPAYPYRNYYYRETVIPLGAKASYYFDQLLSADEKWDFYGGLSLGAAIRTVRWEDGYYGDRLVRNYRSPIFLNLHIGAELHLNQKAGLFLDLSSGMSTFGLALHL